MAERRLSSSPKPRRKLRRVDPKRTLQYAEFEKLKTWAADIVNRTGPEDPLLVRNAAIVLVLLGTAARRFELCAFRCGDFYETNGLPFAYFESGKGNVEAEIPIADETWTFVQRWLTYKRAQGESVFAKSPLFCGRGGEHLSRAQLNNIWNGILAAAGVKKHDGVGVHASRHTAGMLFLRATKSISETREFMRHSSDEITQRHYRHVLDMDVRAGVNKMGER